MEEQGKHTNLDELLSSLGELKRASPSETVFGRLELKLRREEIARVISLPAVSVAAAGIALLLALNILVLRNSTSRQPSGDPVQEVANYYHLTNNTMGI